MQIAKQTERRKRVRRYDGLELSDGSGSGVVLQEKSLSQMTTIKIIGPRDILLFNTSALLTRNSSVLNVSTDIVAIL